MFKLPPLPYPDSALEPVLGAETLRIHHGRHHARYVQVVNEMADGATRSLEALIEDALARADAKLFNNAAQAWNHAFFWESMTPASAPPAGALADAIGGAFGDLAGLPPVLIQVGGEEVLLTDSTALAEKIALGGGDVTLRVWPEMIHVWHFFAAQLDAGMRASQEAGAWIKARTA